MRAVARACGELEEACGSIWSGVKRWVRWGGCVKGDGCDGTRLRQTAKHSSRDAPHRAKSERWLESASEMCRHRQRWGGARAGAGVVRQVRQLGVRDAPALGERRAASACSCAPRRPTCIGKGGGEGGGEG